MCVVCGCSDPGAPTAGARVDATTGDLDYGGGAARVSVPGLDAGRTIRLEADVLGANDRIAASNRRHFEAHGVIALNLLSGPGAGKTTLLVATLRALQRRRPALALGVVEGDQQTSRDAERIRAVGVPAIQVNTGKGCHLDARMVADAFARLPLHDHGHGHDHPPVQGHDGHPARPPALLLIENVGNLVCPALWDLGEHAKVALLSVTEGDDKPLKYPDLFAAASLLLISKVDLLPHVDFDVARCIDHARRVNPRIEVLQVSATRGDGLDAWLDWLDAMLRAPSVAALEQRVAQLEARLRAAGIDP
ncbi:hydrogenase nickel incorporation protein HypB [Azohydromonas sp.]|uniref:hydrogenase nickel incorporation protein HypB n=1 Tax=Azohydromonas sp. TaxID=1872666 RepID=UPI002CE36AFD|nr:hydrogenase nickel incorporation protein HypB [Azohydromonas sp.]HMM84179.1 hydrogenase nickel incorporation protein HypB [Azohydromonas sp.]